MKQEKYWRFPGSANQPLISDERVVDDWGGIVRVAEASDGAEDVLVGVACTCGLQGQSKKGWGRQGTVSTAAICTGAHFMHTVLPLCGTTCSCGTDCQTVIRHCPGGQRHYRVNLVGSRGVVQCLHSASSVCAIQLFNSQVHVRNCACLSSGSDNRGHHWAPWHGPGPGLKQPMCPHDPPCLAVCRCLRALSSQTQRQTAQHQPWGESTRFPPAAPTSCSAQTVLQFSKM
jgi:hypothetical protein